MSSFDSSYYNGFDSKPSFRFGDVPEPSRRNPRHKNLPEEEFEDIVNQFRKDKLTASNCMMAYIALLVEAGGTDRQMVEVIRTQIRNDEVFITHADKIELLAGSDSTWVSAVLRAEARRAQRTSEEVLAKLREEAELVRKAEEAAAREVLQIDPMFGVFG